MREWSKNEAKPVTMVSVLKSLGAFSLLLFASALAHLACLWMGSALMLTDPLSVAVILVPGALGLLMGRLTRFGYFLVVLGIWTPPLIAVALDVHFQLFYPLYYSFAGEPDLAEMGRIAFQRRVMSLAIEWASASGGWGLSRLWLRRAVCATETPH